MKRARARASKKLGSKKAVNKLSKFQKSKTVPKKRSVARSVKKKAIKHVGKAKPQPRAKISAVATPVKKSKIVRIMGHGQYTVNSTTLKKLYQLDSSLVQLVSNERSNDTEFKKGLVQMTELVMKNGKPLDPKEIIKTDIILPSADLSVDEAKKLFVGEGVIPAI